MDVGRQRDGTARCGTRGRRAARGFTLVEMLVVIVVLGVLATLVAPNVFRHVDSARHTAARAQMELLSSALETYRMDNDRYPSAGQGLAALRREPLGEPRPRNWRGPYIAKEVPLDPWRNAYVYRAPGIANPGGFDLVSFGRDGREGGEGEDADLNSWDAP